MAWFRKKKGVNTKRRIIAAVAFVVMLMLNGLAGSTTLLNGQNTAAISDKNVNLFTPAGYTFAIWGIIYLMLGVYVAYQLGWIGSSKRGKLKTETIEAITPYFIATSVLNCVWILAWQYEVLWLSVLLIIGMLYSLVKIEETLKDKDMTVGERVMVRNPFSLYFGWITVATIANICTWLVSIQWGAWGLPPVFWTCSLLIIGACIGLAGMIRNTNCLYGAVLIWAYLGILAKHVSDVGWNDQYPMVIGALWALLAVLTIQFGVTIRKVYQQIIK
ncbi:tryptophan-rich sensory protein [Candidatus Saccharibacteria bacterium]|nr:tryptophan-rich sensory protein [Candidatus Saccharibacteria bacterium]